MYYIGDLVKKSKTGKKVNAIIDKFELYLKKSTFGKTILLIITNH